MSDVATALMRVVEALKGARRAALAEAIRADFPMSDDALAWCVDTTLARYTPEALEALVRTRWEGRRVRVILAATVPLAPLRALALPLLHGAVSVSARASRRQPAVTRVVAETLLAEGLPVRVAHVERHEGEAVVIAYGRDETLATIRDALPPDVVFEGYGHGFGVVLLGEGAGDVSEELATDIAAYDQRGCLSPQVVLALGEGERVAEGMHRALLAREARWPRARLDVGMGASVAQWQGVQAALAAGLWRGPRHAVSWWREARMQASPGARNIAVVSVRDLAQVRALLAPFAAHLSVVGAAGDVGDAWRPEGFAGRVVPVGSMQDPALDGPEDLRPPVVQTPMKSL